MPPPCEVESSTGWKRQCLLYTVVLAQLILLGSLRGVKMRLNVGSEYRGCFFCVKARPLCSNLEVVWQHLPGNSALRPVVGVLQSVMFSKSGQWLQYHDKSCLFFIGRDPILSLKGC